MQRKEIKSYGTFWEKKVWNLKFSLLAQSRLGKDEGLLFPLKHAWKFWESFILLLFYNCTSLARSTTSTPTWLRRNAWRSSQQQESSDQKTCSPGSLIRMLWRPPMKTWRDVIPPNKLLMYIRELLKTKSNHEMGLYYIFLQSFVVWPCVQQGSFPRVLHITASKPLLTIENDIWLLQFDFLGKSYTKNYFVFLDITFFFGKYSLHWDFHEPVASFAFSAVKMGTAKKWGTGKSTLIFRKILSGRNLTRIPSLFLYPHCRSYHLFTKYSM